MTEALRAAPVSALAAEFDDFLFASIGEERNGMLLSVVSALARLNVDPWQEAASLAQLPRTTATRRLASLIATLPDMPSALMDPAANAARLIAHLPRRIGLNLPSAVASSAGIPAVTQSRIGLYVALVLMVALSAISIAAGQRSTARVHDADMPASNTSIPPATSTSGQ
jgi:hypothetical protein